jgi:hypothetical protein
MILHLSVLDVVRPLNSINDRPTPRNDLRSQSYFKNEQGKRDVNEHSKVVLVYVNP